MAELFETYEREYCDLSGSITCDLNDLQSSGYTKHKVEALSNKMDELCEALRNMEIELKSLPSAKKGKLTTRLQNFQKDASNLKKEFDQAKTAASMLCFTCYPS